MHTNLLVSITVRDTTSNDHSAEACCALGFFDVYLFISALSNDCFGVTVTHT